jgi:hypothetical protein
MPQTWSSGVFWPRTGCVLDGTTTLNCSTGQCGGNITSMTGGLLDCGAGSTQRGPTPPITLIELTTSATSANYDVSLNNGYNVETKVTSAGGTGSLCTKAGCTSDLNTTGRSTSCPANLVFLDPRGSGQGVGCYQPLDACSSGGAGPYVSPPAGLSCTSAITKDVFGNTPATTIDCSGNTGGPVTYLDMYEAKNTADSVVNTQATANGGTPTAFSIDDCGPGSEFAKKFVSSGPCTTDADCTTAGQQCRNEHCRVKQPPRVGVCLQFVDDVLVPDWGCSASNIGSACGQYKDTYSDALGYTCQAIKHSGGIAYPCVPSTTSGLGICNTEVSSEGLYPGTGGLFNATWVQAGLQAGGGTTPYYETFKNACRAAYTWQYDDVTGGRSCALTGQPSSGFNIEFCASLVSAPAPTTLAAAVLPGIRSVQVGSTATAFATIINSGTSTGVACTIAPSSPVAGTAFSYQTTDKSTNTPTGSPNTAIDIPASGSQTFVMSFTPSGPVSPVDLQLEFRCSNSTAAPVVLGVNTFRLSAASHAVPDIVALAGTLNDDGIVRVPGVGGTGAFSVATVNVGAGGEITASADTGGASLPVTVSLCRTNPATGACTSAIGPTVTAQINSGETPTFGVFVKANGPIPLDHAASRIFVRFAEQDVHRGWTSVAAQTQ